MKNVVCLSNNQNSELYRLAKESDKYVKANQTVLTIDAGTEVKFFHSAEIARPRSGVIEIKELPTGKYVLKCFLHEDEVICLDQHPINKVGLPTTTFRDRLYLKRHKDHIVNNPKDLERVYSVEGMKGMRGPVISSIWHSAAGEAATQFIKDLVGKDNLLSDINFGSKLKIMFRPENTPSRGTLYNSIAFKYNDIGNCTPLTASTIQNLAEDDIVIRYSFSKRTLFIYTRNHPQEVGEEILKNMERFQPEFKYYVKPETSEKLMDGYYIEPLFKIVNE